MFQLTHGADAASILFDLPGYRVLSVVRGPQRREVLVETVARESACPECGVVSSRVQARPVQQVKDVECGGELVTVRVRKRRYVCAEELCGRRTFTEVTDQLPARARLTTRLAGRVIAQLRAEPRAVSAVAAHHDLSWPTVMNLLTDTIDLTSPDPQRLVHRLGVDEHRFRRVRYVRGEDGSTRRVQPWSVILTDLDTGAILDIIDGPRGQAVKTWLLQRPRWWRHRIEYVAIDMSAEFRAAIRQVLPRTRISVDHWHVVRLANEMVTTVRRRRAWEAWGRRGRPTHPGAIASCCSPLGIVSPPDNAPGSTRSSTPTSN